MLMKSVGYVLSFYCTVLAGDRGHNPKSYCTTKETIGKED